jgi:hypothetical protein
LFAPFHSNSSGVLWLYSINYLGLTKKLWLIRDWQKCGFLSIEINVKTWLLDIQQSIEKIDEFLGGQRDFSATLTNTAFQ